MYTTPSEALALRLSKALLVMQASWLFIDHSFSRASVQSTTSARRTLFRLPLEEFPYVGQALIKGILGFRVEMPVGDVNDVLGSLHGSPHVTQGIGMGRLAHMTTGQADVWQNAVLQISSTVCILWCSTQAVSQSIALQVTPSRKRRDHHACRHSVEQSLSARHIGASLRDTQSIHACADTVFTITISIILLLLLLVIIKLIIPPTTRIMLSSS